MRSLAQAAFLLLMLLLISLAWNLGVWALDQAMADTTAQAVVEASLDAQYGVEAAWCSRYEHHARRRFPWLCVTYDTEGNARWYRVRLTRDGLQQQRVSDWWD